MWLLVPIFVSMNNLLTAFPLWETCFGPNQILVTWTWKQNNLIQIGCIGLFNSSLFWEVPFAFRENIVWEIPKFREKYKFQFWILNCGAKLGTVLQIYLELQPVKSMLCVSVTHIWIYPHYGCLFTMGIEEEFWNFLSQDVWIGRLDSEARGNQESLDKQGWHCPLVVCLWLKMNKLQVCPVLVYANFHIVYRKENGRREKKRKKGQDSYQYSSSQ